MSVASPETLPLRAPAPTGTGLPLLRLLPAPLSEPPYDDELPDGARLRLVPARPDAPPPAPVVPLRVVPAVPVADDDDGRTPLAALPEPRPFAQALVQRLLEVLAGLRPVGQLQRDTTLEVYDDLTARLRPGQRATGPRPSPRDIRSVHVQARADGVAEVCATVRREGRTTALALRLEGRSGAWRCTALVGV